jgi:predicted transcriptional regulator
MRRDPQDLPDAEPAVLKRLWQQGPATIGQLTDAVYPESTEANTTAAPG